MKKMKNVVFACLLFIFYNQITFAQVNTEKMRKDESELGFNQKIDLLFGINKGNEEFTKVEGSFRTDYIAEKFITFLVGNIEYVEGNNSIISNKGFLHLRTVKGISNIIDLEVFAQSEFNRFIRMRERYLGGSDIRIKPFNYYDSDSSTQFSLRLSIGAMYEYENQGTNNSHQIYRLIRSTNNLNIFWKINEVFSLSEIVYFQPDLGNFNDYRILNDFSLVFSISSHFKFITTLNYRYDSDPTADLKKYDLELQNGFEIEF